MILIADSGSTKTDWAIIGQGSTVVRVQTQGMNPYFQTPQELAQEINNVLKPVLPNENVEYVFFYGAGCTPEKAPEVSAVLTRVLAVKKTVEVHSDLLAAARALCGRDKGIACILGTGSNSCLYDGEKIVANVSPLGFILGDEGSGAVLGKLLLGDILKNQLGKELREDFLERYGVTPSDVIDRVYRQAFPNRYLASFAPFLLENLRNPRIHRLVLQNFVAFLQRNVLQYEGSTQLPVHFTGSIAYHFQEVLKDAVAECGLQMGRIAQSPMQGLIEYHSSKVISLR
ncbi:MAG: ATPase [Bacteroidaceae bacterium]|nr:ATPase [Bacteroidaceae bacterium]